MAITCTPGVVAAVGVRASVNHQWFVEADPGVAAGFGVAAKVRTGIGTAAVVVDSWTPDDGDDDVPHNHSFKLNLHANADLIEKEVLYDGDGTFAAGGTLTDVDEVGDGVQLSTTAPETDFEDYLTTDLANAGQPQDWTNLTTNPWPMSCVAVGTDGWDGQHGYCWCGNGNSFYEFSEAGDMQSGEAYTDWYADSQTGYSGFMGIATNLTGSGSALRGHAVGVDRSQYPRLARINHEDSTTWVANGNLGYTPAADTPYRLAVRWVYNGAGATDFYYKFWLRSAAEPAGWTWLGADTVYTGAGGVGVWVQAGYYGAIMRWDNMSYNSIPATYVTEGDWTSDPIDMTDLVHYSYALLDWDETTPADTTVAVKARWRNGGTWLACTNGGEVPGIDLGEDTTAGSSKDSLELRVELATTDTSATPVVENLRFYHVPLASAALEVDVGGDSCVEANETLEVWGKQDVVGAVVEDTWDDWWLETHQPYHLFGLDYALLVSLSYNGVEIDSIIVSTDRDYWGESVPDLEAQFSMDPIKYASAPVEARWVCWAEWAPMGHVYEWVLVDYSMGMRADAQYIVGHYQVDDHPSGLVVAQLELADHPGSCQVRGYQLDDYLGGLLVQGWQPNDFPAMFMPGVWYLLDTPAMVLPANRQLADFPASVQVFSVNRDGHIEINVVSAETWAAMVAAGYGVAP